MPVDTAVHPHLRGAYHFNLSAGIRYFGSSPPTWGIRVWKSGSSSKYRFIPTYVGHTSGPAGFVTVRRVHPHLRGAYTKARQKELDYDGSSPPTWGIRNLSDADLDNIRFIPTYVGHTKTPKQRTSWRRGSSPPTWGIHWTTVRKMAGFSHFSYDFTRKSYFVQGLVFFGVIGAEASPTHRRGRSQCLPGSHGGSVRNL